MKCFDCSVFVPYLQRFGFLFWFILAAAVGVAYATLAMAISYTYPTSDDFCYSLQVIKHGWEAAQFYWYESWSGRFTATALMTLYPWLAEIKNLPEAMVYRYIVAGVLGSLALAWVLILSVIWRLHPVKSVVLGMAGAALMILSTFDVVQALFWLPGALTYTVSISATIFLTFLCLGFSCNHLAAIWKVGLLALAVPLAIAIPGFNEPLGLFWIAFLSLSIVMQLYNRKGLNLWFVLVLLAIIAGLALVILAPGNAVRSAAVGHVGNPIHALIAGPLLATDFYLRMIDLDVFVWLGAMFMLASASKNHLNTLAVTVWARWFPVAVLAVPLTFAIGIYVTGGTLPGRTENMLYMLLVFGSTGGALWLGQRYTCSMLGKAPAAAAGLAALLLAVGLMGKEFHLRAVHEYFNLAPQYHAEVLNRTIRLTHAEDMTDVRVPNYTEASKLVRFHDLTADPRENGCVASYYGLRSVRVEFGDYDWSKGTE